MKLASQTTIDMAPGGDSISPDTAFRVAASYPGASQSPSAGAPLGNLAPASPQVSESAGRALIRRPVTDRNRFPRPGEG
jgi:hypothetical protein